MGFVHSTWTSIGNSSALTLATVLFVLSNLFVACVSWGTGLAIETRGYDLSSYCYFDCGWYSSIVKSGYDLMPHAHERGDAANWAFFPLLPVAAKIIGELSPTTPQIALIIASKIFLFAAIYSFINYAARELGSSTRLLAGLMVAFNPYIIYAHSGYTESLYFALTTLGFIFLLNRHWLASGLAGALLSATRLTGLLFALSYLTVLFSHRRQLTRSVDQGLLAFVGLLLCPMGLFLFMLFLYYHVGDALAFKHIQVAWGRELQNPFDVLISARGQEIAYAAIAVAGLAIAIKLSVGGRAYLGVFLAAAVIVPLSTGLWSMMRYVWWQMPFLFGILEMLKNDTRLQAAYVVLSLATAVFTTAAWFVGAGFMI